MEAVIREYTVEAGQMQRIVRQIEEKVPPIVRSIPSFVEYVLFTASETQFVSIALSGNKPRAEESSRIANDTIARILGDSARGEPRVSGGEVIFRHSGPNKEAHYAIMRRFHMTSEDILTGLLRVREGLLPILRATPGFVSYSGIDCGDGTAISFGEFENRQTADVAVQHATDWFKQAIQNVSLPESIPGDIKVRVLDEYAVPQT